MKKLLLIDANSLIHRAFHALPPMTTASGEPSQAIYGVARILLKLWREERPEFAAALFDRPEPTFRDKIYKEYKGHRPPAPNELISQLIEIHNLFPLFGIKTFELAGFEADDLIATFAEKFKKEKDIQITIFTGDLDSLQLVDGKKITVRVPQKGISETTIYDPVAVEARYGLPPEKLPDYKALVGDASDNIKGVSGIGPKTAAKMLKNYKNLEELFGAPDLEPEFAKKLLPHKAQAFLSKKLVTLIKDAPIEVKNLEALKTSADTVGLEQYFESKGFASLLKQIREPAVPKPEKKKEPKAPQGSLF
ncbi:MAG: 5'-3' exonuclease H3TH domain-containing protein [Candidatus Liptonbacteria bacterium]|nr:5'-3' exonuclease H3TH domain-containing protein [Candidatus Liptonbacteria bacterium]